MSKKSRIGRGLSSLLGGADLDIRTVEQDKESRILLVPLDVVEANPGQPRKDFPQETLDDLRNSIKSKGIISPIIVRQVGEKYEIVAGERRYRAAKEAGLEKIPVIVKNIEEKEVLEIAIIENIQRQALNAMEEAESYKALMETCGYTQYDVGTIVGKSRSYISNLIRLLSLPEKVLEYLRQGKITIGHARALVGEDNAQYLADKIVNQKLNVRQIEKIIQKKKENPETKDKDLTQLLDDLKSIEDLLAKKLDAKVKIIQGKKKLDTGEIRLKYSSLEELDKFLQILSKG